MFAYHPSETGRELRESGKMDVWGKWKERKLFRWDQRKPIYVALFVVLVVFLATAAFKADPWVATALGAPMLAFAWVELTCYYYMFLMVPALLYEKRRSAGLWLLAACAASSAVGLKLNKGLWNEEVYTLCSLFFCVAFAAILVRFSPLYEKAHSAIRRSC